MWLRYVGSQPLEHEALVSDDFAGWDRACLRDFLERAQPADVSCAIVRDGRRSAAGRLCPSKDSVTGRGKRSARVCRMHGYHGRESRRCWRVVRGGFSDFASCRRRRPRRSRSSCPGQSLHRAVSFELWHRDRNLSDRPRSNGELKVNANKSGHSLALRLHSDTSAVDQSARARLIDDADMENANAFAETVIDEIARASHALWTEVATTVDSETK